MKKLKTILPILLIAIFFTSCSSIRVATDYDKEVNFDNYESFAFFKPGIDKAQISDLDKKRILRAIEYELTQKGFSKSENPDILISIFTESNQKVDVYNNGWGMGAWGMGAWGWGMPGWGWGWGAGWGGSQVSTSVEGVLFIDIIDASKKELIWQGSGKGNLVTKNVDKKEERIKNFVSEIMMNFPPQIEDK